MFGGWPVSERLPGEAHQRASRLLPRQKTGSSLDKICWYYWDNLAGIDHLYDYG